MNKKRKRKSIKKVVEVGDNLIIKSLYLEND